MPSTLTQLKTRHAQAIADADDADAVLELVREAYDFNQDDVWRTHAWQSAAEGSLTRMQTGTPGLERADGH